METATPELLETLAHKQVSQWLERVAEFRRWERANVLIQEPSPKVLQEHRRTLRYMISMTRMMLNSLADPELHHAELFSELEGVLVQLNHSWEMIHNALTDEALHQAMEKYFPG